MIQTYDGGNIKRGEGKYNSGRNVMSDIEEGVQRNWAQSGIFIQTSQLVFMALGEQPRKYGNQGTK